MKRALECCADHGGVAETGGADAHRDGAAGLWRTAFIRMPYAREFLAPAGIINDTFGLRSPGSASRRSTTRSSRYRARHRRGDRVAGRSHLPLHACLPRRSGALLLVSCARPSWRSIEQWRAIKGAASDALIAAGGTITHHHAVGRDHRPWYDRQRPELFAAALRAAKGALDPRGMMNPGVLIEP